MTTPTVKDKDRLQMYVSLTRITIVLCWLSLFAFWVIKIFGGNFFEIMVENEKFIAFSAKVQTSWLKYLVSFFTITIGNYFMFGAIAEKFIFKGKQMLIVTLLIISLWAVVNFIPNLFYLSFWYGYTVIILFGVFCQKRWKRLNGIIAVALQFLFTTLSMLTRNISLGMVDDYLVLLIFTIDLYLMYGLYYLHSNLIKLNKEI